ncbi:hypothetical protein NC652_030837 [Populus alba x Populus x berolinensis]|nr:hypothetical protein NC652_030837 [Populus alba x Populus x berolinensis]
MEQIDGEYFRRFGLYPNLIYVELSHNDLSGELAWKLGGFHILASLKLSNNNITGEIYTIRAWRGHWSTTD